MTDRRKRAGEFDLIDRYFRPLAAAWPPSLNLSDDAALLPPSPNQETVVSKDMCVSGVHFLPDTPPELALCRALRVNLSDLAAMGAAPQGYFMGLALPDDIDEDWVSAACGGLASDQETFGIGLLGGDVVSTAGPLVISLTVAGLVPMGGALRRSGAQPGDLICVSGAVGDAGLGLSLLAGALSVEVGQEYLISRHRMPTPRLGLGQALRGRATAAIDVSDGLVADLTHIAEASGVGAEIEISRIPVSPAASRAGVALTELATSGDDYELLFTLPSDQAEPLRSSLSDDDPPITPIGEVTGGGGVRVVDADGDALDLGRTGWRHR